MNRSENLLEKTEIAEQPGAEWPIRLYALDVSRGIASLSVVLWHWQHFFYEGPALPKGFLPEAQPLFAVFKLFYQKGSMGVDYFFLLSGFIFFWIYREPIRRKVVGGLQFFIQRFSRLYPLHAATLILVAVLQFFFAAQNGTSFVYPHNDAYHFLLNLGFASKWGLDKGWSFNAPVWSVSIEVLLYAVFFVAAFFGRGGPVFSLTVSLLAYGLFHGANFGHPVFEGLALFFFGGVAFYFTSRISRGPVSVKRIVLLSAALSWALVFVSFYVVDLRGTIRQAGMIGRIALICFPDYFLFPLTICSLALLEIDRGAFLKTFAWIGDITYSSYLLHFPLQLLFMLAAGFGLLPPTFRLSPGYLIMFFSILLAMSCLTYRYFEMPAQRLIRARFARQGR